MNASIVLATRNPQFEQRVRRLVEGDVRTWPEGVDAPDPEAAVDAVAAKAPDLVAVGPGLDFHEWMRLAQAFDRRHPEVTVVLVAEPSPRLWEQALRAGVRDVVSPDADDAELRSVLDRALGTSVRRKANLLGEPDPGPIGRVITVVGPKGGVGKTTIATNLAVGLALAAPREVVLVDLDLQFGDVGHALRVEPDRTIADVLRVNADEDPTALKVFLVPHPSGLYVLYAPDSPADVDDMSPERVAGVVRALSRMFPYVVVDTGSGLDEFALVGVEVATDVVLVGVTDVPSVRGMRKEIETFDRIGMTGHERHFVLNRSDAQVGLSRGDIEQTVGMPVSVALPASSQITVSVNQGNPIIAGADGSPCSEALIDLMSRFAEVPAAALRGRKRKGRALVR